jgi:hypothetical protein
MKVDRFVNSQALTSSVLDTTNEFLALTSSVLDTTIEQARRGPNVVVATFQLVILENFPARETYGFLLALFLITCAVADSDYNKLIVSSRGTVFVKKICW